MVTHSTFTVDDEEINSSDARELSERFCEKLGERDFRDTILSEIGQLLERGHSDIMRDVEYKLRDKLEGKSPQRIKDLCSDFERDLKGDLVDRIDRLEGLLERWLRDWRDTLMEIPERADR